MTKLTQTHAAQFMALTLGHLTREFPHKLDHVMDGPADVRRPSDLHPIFHGSFDFHSCVHGYWQVMRLARLYPDLPEAARVRAHADRMLTAENFAGELAYLASPSTRGFVRPYGWAWVLALHGELARHDAAQNRQGWAAALEPLARLLARRLGEYLTRMTYPIRVGTHFNSSFACALGLDWARTHDAALAALIERRAVEWFGGDRGCQAWEPGGDEFLSSALTEALLMSEILPPGDFAAWFDRFLPRAALGQPASLFTPAEVSDRSDGKIAHLDGLNLSRAWCWRAIAARLGPAHPASGPAEATAQAHLAASLPHVAGDYMGEHWLATFALLALEGAG